MNDSKHVSRDELLDLIGGEHDSPNADRIGDHVHACSTCRNRLDELAAHADIWDKAPELLKSDLSARMNLSSDGYETTEFPADAKEEPSESEWSWPLETILESPRHPEMIGRIGDYDIEREIGHGGMGIVLKAHEAELNRPLAIKVLAPHLASHGPARQRFAQEARSAAGVIHPNVIAVHRVENSGKTPYIVMPYVAGPSLQSLVEDRGPLPEDEIVRLSLQISAGLTAAHSQGLVHRDIKPANMLVADGGNRVLITDFGLARAEDDASLTRTGWLTGTPNYMSPEQTRGERLDHRSDLFSLGSLIYFLATGRLPFRSETPFGVLKRIQEDDPTPVRQVNRKISKTVAEIIEVLLEKDPNNRFQTAAELHEVLNKQMFYLHQPDIAKPPIVRQKPVKQQTANSRMYLWGSMVAGGFGLLAMAGWMLSWSGLTISDQTAPSKTKQTETVVAKAEQDQGDGTAKLQIEINSDQDIKTLTGSGLANGFVVTSGLEIDQELDHENEVEINEKAWEAFDEAVDLFHDKRYEKAIGLFQKSAKLKELKSKSFYNIGCALAKQGKLESAIDQLEIAIENGFDDYGHYLEDTDIDALRESDRFKTIIARLKQLDESRDELGTALALSGEGNYEEAVEKYNEILQVDSDNEMAWLNLGYALHMLEKYDQAMQWHRKAANGNDHRAIGLYNVACVEAIRGSSDAAFEALTSSINEGLADKLGMDHIRDDSDLDSIRGDSRFSDFLKKFTLAEARNACSRFTLTDQYNVAASDEFNGFADSDDFNRQIEGDWSATIDDDELELQIIRSSDDATWTWVYSQDHDLSDFDPTVDKDSLEFVWEKKFGKLVFSGSFDGVNGEGEFEFVASDDYRKNLADKGLEEAPDALLFRLFFSEDEKKVIKNLDALVELGLDENLLSRLAVSGVAAKRVKAYQKAELNLKDHADFLVWRVKPKLVVSYIDAELDPSDYRDFIKKRVDGSLVKKYRQLGLKPNEFKKLITSRVSPETVQQYVDAKLDVRELSSFVVQRVPAALIQDYQDAGFSVDKYRSFLSQRVPAKLLQDYEDAGLPAGKFAKLIRQRIPVSLVESYRDAGFDLKKYSKFIVSRVSIELLERYKDAGLDPLNFKNAVMNRRNPKDILSTINEAKQP